MRLALLLLSILTAGASFAQSNEIYGLTRNNNPGVTYLAKVNTTNGIISDISADSYSEVIANFSSTVDPVQGIFYFTNLDSFIGIDMTTGLLVHDNVITGAAPSIFQNFMYDEISEEIIGLERVGTEGDIYLSKIDPSTGILTRISENPLANNNNTISASGTAIDLRNRWYHVFTVNKILSIDIETGTIVHDPMFDTSEFQNFNNIFYNPVDNDLYVLGRNSSPNEIFLTKIDPITGVVTTISPTTLAEAIALEGSAFDPFAGIYYFKRPWPTTTLVGVDVNTGIEVSNAPFDFSSSAGAFFGYFYFGGETRSLLLSNDEFITTNDINVYPNPAEDILNIKGRQITQITVYSPTGQEIANRSFNNDTFVQLDISGYAKGVYFIKAVNELNDETTLKFIKN